MSTKTTIAADIEWKWEANTARGYYEGVRWAAQVALRYEVMETDQLRTIWIVRVGEDYDASEKWYDGKAAFERATELFVEEITAWEGSKR